MTNNGILRSLMAAAVAGVAVAALATPAAAVSKRVQQSCKSDYKRLCPAYKVGSPSMKACMDANQGAISSPCREALIDSGEVDRYRAQQARRSSR